MISKCRWKFMVDSFWYLEWYSHASGHQKPALGYLPLTSPCFLFTFIARCKSVSMSWLGFCIKYIPVVSAWLRVEKLMIWNPNFSCHGCLARSNFDVHTSTEYSHCQKSGLCISSSPWERFRQSMFPTREYAWRSLWQPKLANLYRKAQVCIDILALVPALGEHGYCFGPSLTCCKILGNYNSDNKTNSISLVKTQVFKWSYLLFILW